MEISGKNFFWTFIAAAIGNWPFPASQFPTCSGVLPTSAAIILLVICFFAISATRFGYTQGLVIAISSSWLRTGHKPFVLVEGKLLITILAYQNALRIILVYQNIVNAKFDIFWYTKIVVIFIFEMRCDERRSIQDYENKISNH